MEEIFGLNAEYVYKTVVVKPCEVQVAAQVARSGRPAVGKTDRTVVGVVHREQGGLVVAIDRAAAAEHQRELPLTLVRCKRCASLVGASPGLPPHGGSDQKCRQ